MRCVQITSWGNVTNRYSHGCETIRYDWMDTSLDTRPRKSNLLDYSHDRGTQQISTAKTEECLRKFEPFEDLKGIPGFTFTFITITWTQRIDLRLLCQPKPWLKEIGRRQAIHTKPANITITNVVTMLLSTTKCLLVMVRTKLLSGNLIVAR